MSSLFSKLSKPTTVSGSGVRSGSWRASLVRHEESSNFVLSGSVLPLKNLARGCVVQATAVSETGPASSFLVSFNSDNTSSTEGSLVISGNSKILESLGVGRDVKELEFAEHEPTPEVLEHNTLDLLVIRVKNRYISKRELWKFQIRLLGSVLFKNDTSLSGLNCEATVADMNKNRVDCLFGIVGPQTRIVVRSESAQIVLFLLVSAECWDFNPTTREPNFAKMIQFLLKSFSEAIASGKTHHLTLLITMRPLGHREHDVYEKVYEGPIQSLNVKNLIENLKFFFNFFPKLSHWNVEGFNEELPADASYCFFLGDLRRDKVSFVKDSALCGCSQANTNVTLVPCNTNDENILEAINLAISHFSKLHMDRKLHLTGTQITLLTCNTGTGIRCADRGGLFEVSRRLVSDSACGIKIVSVGQRPAIVRPTRVLVSYTREYFGRPSEEVENIEATWLPINFITGSYPIGSFDDFEISNFFSGKPKMHANLDTRTVPIPKPFHRERRLRERRTDSEIAALAVVVPRLQRVATEANIRASDIKQIDNWIVQGEGLKTLHDLIGMRLSMDMQMIDISGTAMDDTSMGPPVLRQVSHLSDSAEGDGMISANVFGVKVHRSSMRESHITKVLIKGEDKYMWNLHHLDSGNVFVSKVELISANGAISSRAAEDTLYSYVLRDSSCSESSTMPLDLIVCKNCQIFSDKISIEMRVFAVPPPLPWNVIDDLIANTYIQQSLPSMIPAFNEAVPPELVGLKLRSSIKSALYVVLLPSDSAMYLKRKLEALLQVKHRIVRKGEDWFWFHSIVGPHYLMFSLEWLLCQSTIIATALMQIKTACNDDNFVLLKIPHAQIFSELPFQNSIVVDHQFGTSFLSLFVSRLVSLLGMVVIIREEATGFLLLCSKEGSFFASIRNNRKITWIPNYTNTWGEDARDDLMFLRFRQIIHTSVIDSTRQG